MRAVLDTNLWSSLGDDDSVDHFEEILRRKNATVCVPPSTLLEVVNIPHESVRVRIIKALALGRRRTRLPTEAESYSMEVVRLIRRTHPEWVRILPNSSLASSHRTFWMKKVWSEAVADSTRMHEYQATQRPIQDHIVERQKKNRRSLLKNQAELKVLTELTGSSDQPAQASLPGWDGSAATLWRLNLAQLTWHQLGVIGPRALLTGEDRTMTDWVEPYIQLARVRSQAAEFVRMWLEEAQVLDVPRNWLSWAVDTVQWTEKIGTGNPADAQHAAYLIDCDVFLTADVRFARILERVREDAPFPFAQVLLVSGDRSIPTTTRIESAWR